MITKASNIKRPEGKMYDYFSDMRADLNALSFRNSGTPKVVEMVSRMEREAYRDTAYLQADNGFGATLRICEMILHGDTVKLVQMISKMNQLENKIYAYRTTLSNFQTKTAFLRETGHTYYQIAGSVEECILHMQRAILAEEYELNQLEVAFMQEVLEWDNTIISTGGDERGFELACEKEIAGETYLPLNDHYFLVCCSASSSTNQEK